jgi:trehalose utilization protein
MREWARMALEENKSMRIPREVYLISWLSPQEKNRAHIGVKDGKGCFRVTHGHGTESWNFYHAQSLAAAIEYCENGSHLYEIEPGTPTQVVYLN